MQSNIPSDVLQALAADTRYIIPEVKIYFDGPNSEPTTFTQTDIIDCQMLTETGTQAEFIVGNVCSGTLELSLENNNGRFNATNESSPFYGKLVPGVKIEVFVLVDRDLQDNFYTIKMGTYYAAQWPSSAGSLTCDVLAYDRLYWILNRETAVIPLYRNITGAQFFENLMQQLRIENYTVDESLTTVIPYAYTDGSTIGEKLAYACSGIGAVVYVNREDTIVVQNAFNRVPNDLVVNDENYIYDVKATPSLSKQYDKVTVALNNIGAMQEDSLVQIEELEVPPGAHQISNLTYSHSPVVRITKIIVRGATNTTLTSHYTGIQSGSFSFYNSGDSTEKISLEIFGRYLLGYTNDVSVGDVSGTMQTEYRVTSPLIQTAAFAEYYAGELYDYANNIIPQVEIRARGIPQLDMGDLFTLQSNEYKLDAAVTPIQITHKLTDGVTTDLVCLTHKANPTLRRRV